MFWGHPETMRLQNKKDFKKVNLYLFLRIFFIIRFKNSKLTLDPNNKNSNIKCEYAIIR